MILLKNNSTILDINEFNNEFPIEIFDLKRKYKNGNYSLLIDFKNDKKYSKKCIKKLKKMEEKNISFNSEFNNLHIKYIIANYNDDILKALEALNTHDFKEQYTLIYDYTFSKLDSIWSKENSCNFCNNKCIATRNKKFINQVDGCCYSFEYTDKFFSKSFIKNKKKCKYLGANKQCTTQNISCKFFTCPYLKKYKNFKLNINNFLIIDSFFSKKQKLILQYNYFHSKEEIINKLLEKNSSPFLLYYFKSQYRLK